MIWALIRLWRRLRTRETPPLAPHCAIDVHRDTLEPAGGYLLQLRCLDCGRTEVLGWVFAGVSNRRPQPWEHDDA